MRFPALSPAGQLAAAKVNGLVSRLSVGAGRQVDAEAVVAQVRAVSSDPVVMGHVLGVYLARLEEDPQYEAAVELLRVAGADEGTAREMLAWQRERRAKEKRRPVQFETPGKR